MILQAKTGHWLTENFDVDYSERRFLQTISLANSDEAKYWKEISNQEKESMMEQGQLFDVSNLSYDYLNKVDTLLAGVSDKINEVELTTEQKLEKKSYFPKWNDLIGESAEPEFNFQHGDDLFEVLQPHTFAAEWGRVKPVQNRSTRRCRCMLVRRKIPFHGRRTCSYTKASITQKRKFSTYALVTAEFL